MAKSSLLVVAVLEALFAFSFMVLIFVLLRRQQASGLRLTESVRRFRVRVQRPVLLILLFIALWIGADFLLPPERINTEVSHRKSVNDRTIEVFYGLCCSGGGTASCQVPSTSDFALRQSILVQRSRLLDRCSMQPSVSLPIPCECGG